MAKLSDVTEDFPWALIIGVAAVAVLGGPRIVEVGRPLFKSAIKEFMSLRSRMHQSLAVATEHLQDIYAEAQYEYQENQHTSSPSMVGEGQKEQQA